VLSIFEGDDEYFDAGVAAVGIEGIENRICCHRIEK
jgi:hypothetical protein